MTTSPSENTEQAQGSGPMEQAPGSGPTVQEKGSDHTEKAPGSGPTVQEKGSDCTEKALGSSPTVQEKGSEHVEKEQGSHNTEQAEGSRESTPSYETSVSDIPDPRIERNARREYARDPDYNPEIEEVNYSFIIICFYTFMRLIHNYMSLYE
jgi:hypothetical protein